MTNEHTSVEKYTSHFIRKGSESVEKGLCVRGELETELTATYWPQVLLTIAVPTFSFCCAAQPGVLRTQAFCWELVLTASNCNSNSNCNWLQLTEPVCGTGLYNCLTPTCFLLASHLHRIQPSTCQGDIFDRMHLFLDWRLGRRSICYTNKQTNNTFTLRTFILQPSI